MQLNEALPSSQQRLARRCKETIAPLIVPGDRFSVFPKTDSMP